jgi:hypothetical protein
MLVLLAVTFHVSSPSVYGDDDEYRASAGDWIYLGAIAASMIALALIILVSARRNLNAHTGLPSRVKRRRARGPLKR